MASTVENAKRANAVVKKKLSIGPGNRWFSGVGAVLCVKEQRRASMKEVEGGEGSEAGLPAGLVPGRVSLPLASRTWRNYSLQ